MWPNREEPWNSRRYADQALLEKYLPPLEQQNVPDFRSVSTHSSLSSANSSTASSLYTTAPSTAGGGLYQSLAGGNTRQQRRVLDLESYNQLKDAFVTRKANAHGYVHPNDNRLVRGLPFSEPAPQRSQVSLAADDLVAKYEQRRSDQAALTNFSRAKERYDGPTSGSPDWIRHKLALQTAGGLFDTDGTNNNNEHARYAPTSPRSWQDDVMRNISAIPELSVQAARAPQSSFLDPSDAVTPRPSTQGEDDDGFRDALDCTEEDTLDVIGSSNRDVNVSLVPAATAAVSTARINHSTVTAAREQDIRSHLNDSRAPTRSPSQSQLARPSSEAVSAASMLAELIKDKDILQGVENLHTRIDVVRSIMARKALSQVEESTRAAITRRSLSFFGNVMLFLDEVMSRTTLVEREGLVRIQLAAASQAVARRETARNKLFDDWANSETVERKRLVHQRDLFMSSLEGPIQQLRRIWSPQHAIVLEEGLRRDTIMKQFSGKFCEMALYCLDRSEELHRRQLLTARDPMLSVRGVFGARLEFARTLVPHEPADAGYFLSNDGDQRLAQTQDDGDDDISVLSPVDLLALRGASAEDIACAAVLFQGTPGRVIDIPPPQSITAAKHDQLLPTHSAPPMPNESSSPLEWSSFFLRSSAPIKSLEGLPSSSRGGRSSMRQTPVYPVHRSHAAAACSVDIAVPTHLWTGWYGDLLLTYFRNRQDAGWTVARIRRLMQRFVCGHFIAPLTLVDYFAMWRPAIRLMFLEGEGRVRIADAALVQEAPVGAASTQGLGGLLSWHRQAVFQINVANEMQRLLKEYVLAADLETKQEATIRGALYGFFAAWKGRCVFMMKLAEVEDESWEQALQAARQNAMAASALHAVHGQVSSSVSASSSAVTSRPRSPVPECYQASAASGQQQGSAPSMRHLLAESLSNIQQVYVDDGGDSRSSSSTTPSRANTGGYGHLPRRPLEALADVMSPFAASSSTASSQQQRFHTTPPPQPPGVLVMDTSRGSSLTQHQRIPSESISSRSDNLIGELFALADVSATGWVKLANVAAALRLQHICFDLPRVARCFQRASHVYDEMSGLKDATSKSFTTSTVYGSAVLNRESFGLMLQILLNDLKATKELPPEIAQRWEYEQRYLRQP